MNILTITKGIRSYGINYGAPVTIIQIGFGRKVEPPNLALEILGMNLPQNSWVVIKGNPARERGFGFFMEGWRKLGSGIRLEAEDDGGSIAPSWFPNVDRWTVEFVKNSNFNYGSLRQGQDMLIYRGTDIPFFLDKTKNIPVVRGIITENREEAWNLLKDTTVRIYRKEEEEM